MAATPLFVQAQSFALQASGASTGDTSIILQSFNLSDGTTKITTTMIGSVCYGTLEPNNGTQEEAIQFTGVTQNANGTATLTGVSSVGFISPYTATSGLAKSHAGGITFILSNDAAFYGNIVSYINGVVASGASLASTSVAGISKLSVTPATGSNPISVGDNDSRVLSQTNANYVNSIVNTGIPYAVATGTPTAYTATLASSVSSLASGTYLNVLIPTSNATGITLNVNSLGAKSIKKNVSTSLASGDLISGEVASLAFDGTNFQLVSPPANAFNGLTSSGQTTKNVNDASTTQNIPHGLGVIPKYVRLTVNMIDASSHSVAYEVISTQSGITYFLTTYTSASWSMNTDTAINLSDTALNGTQSGVLTVTSTNISIAWTKTSSPPATTARINWVALA